jgi:membrane protein required for colicin V production
MPIADILIVLVVVISVIVGFVRGFVKEAISIASLLIAIWAALYFGARVGAVSANWFSSQELQLWFGRILVFIVVLTIGGLVGWGISKLVRLSILSGTDRVLGILFGFCRGALIIGVVVLGGQYAGFGDSAWWKDSLLMPYGEFVADWLTIMAPKALEMLQPGDIINDLAAVSDR